MLGHTFRCMVRTASVRRSTGEGQETQPRECKKAVSRAAQASIVKTKMGPELAHAILCAVHKGVPKASAKNLVLATKSTAHEKDAGHASAPTMNAQPLPASAAAGRPCSSCRMAIEFAILVAVALVLGRDGATCYHSHGMTEPSPERGAP